MAETAHGGSDAARDADNLVSRCNAPGAMLIASSRALGAWGEVSGDPVVATAILGRPRHHSQLVTIRDESHRQRET